MARLASKPKRKPLRKKSPAKPIHKPSPKNELAEDLIEYEITMVDGEQVHEFTDEKTLQQLAINIYEAREEHARGDHNGNYWRVWGLNVEGEKAKKFHTQQNTNGVGNLRIRIFREWK